MKLKVITLTAISALSLGSFAFAHEPKEDNPGERGGRGGGNHHSALEKTTEKLNLTPEQKAKVQPIIDQATPQIQTIHRDAMKKIKTVVDNAMAQIRPMLTPEQQKMLDESQNERRDGRGGDRNGHGDQEEQGDQ